MREHLDIDVPEPTIVGSGASVVAGDQSWTYARQMSAGVLGTAVVWSNANGASVANVITDQADGPLAYVASGFAEPRPVIWHAIERSLHLVDAVEPTIPAPPDCVEHMAVLANADLDVVADHGVWIGEINGLEVARVGERDGTCAIDIGVGAYDQFAMSALNVDTGEAESLARVVSMVRPFRERGAEPHPIGRLVRSRWLRAEIVRSPDVIGLESVDPIPLLIPRPGLVESQPAAALGYRSDGTKVLVVCSTGIDLGVAETAAGLIRYHGPNEVVVAMPPRDHHPRIVESLDALSVPAVLAPLIGEWSDEHSPSAS